MRLNVNSIIWDLDGTLYPADLNIFEDARRKVLKRLSEHFGSPLMRVEEEYDRLYDEHGSYTKTFELLGVGEAFGASDSEILLELTDGSDRSALDRDGELLGMFNQLSDYEHVLLTNSGRVGTEKTLDALGLDEKVFSKVFTANDLEEIKPHPRSFLRALAHLNDYFHNVLSVGDRDRIDIQPARDLGLRTAKVWVDRGEESRTGLADVELDTVYEIVHYL